MALPGAHQRPRSAHASIARYAALLTALRWVCLTAGLAAAAPQLPGDRGVLAGTVLVFSATLWRTIRPLQPNRAATGLASDLAMVIAAVIASGASESPYVFALLPSVLLAGLAWGYPSAIFSVLLAGIALVASDPDAPSSLIGGPSWHLLLALLLAAAIGSYARRLSIEHEASGRAREREVERLREANALLAELHRVALSLPSSLDLRETLDSAASALRERFEADAVVILLAEPSSEDFRPGTALGVRLASRVDSSDLPEGLTRAVATRAIVRIAASPQDGPHGISRRAASALYVPLLARERLVGLLAVEAVEAGRFGESDAQLIGGFAEPLALALDNAAWFRRLRALGADAERDRLARDLHDHLGQGLAYLALELDRLSARRPEDAELANVRNEARGLVREVRQTLSDLRADVTGACDLATLAEAHLDRIQDREGLSVHYQCDTGSSRLSVVVERELWRILQEATENVTRHAGASTLEVSWRIDPTSASLEVRDDGRGFIPTNAIPEAPGIARMRERANALGARLDVVSSPGMGTLVRVELDQ
ncbi:MAG: GAF domain-containing protein [Acidimicrobiia bacterium]